MKLLRRCELPCAIRLMDDLLQIDILDTSALPRILGARCRAAMMQILGSEARSSLVATGDVDVQRLARRKGPLTQRSVRH